jgi:hypothetical protein
MDVCTNNVPREKEGGPATHLASPVEVLKVRLDIHLVNNGVKLCFGGRHDRLKRLRVHRFDDFVGELCPGSLHADKFRVLLLRFLEPAVVWF